MNVPNLRSQPPASGDARPRRRRRRLAPFGCEACAKQLYSIRHVQRHYWRRHGLAIFFCQWEGCNRFFADLRDKLDHEVTHIEQRQVIIHPAPPG